VRRAAVLLVAACLLVCAPAHGVTVSVTVTDDAFGPTSVTVPLGGSVHWVNQGTHTHTSTSDKGIAFDVQYRREGTVTWRAFRTNTLVATGLFNPTRSARYFLRARTTNTATGQEAGWSPLLSKRIT
jgi:plastocyanin